MSDYFTKNKKFLDFSRQQMTEHGVSLQDTFEFQERLVTGPQYIFSASNNTNATPNYELSELRDSLSVQITELIETGERLSKALKDATELLTKVEASLKKVTE